jgi:hypothetical protein
VTIVGESLLLVVGIQQQQDGVTKVKAERVICFGADANTGAPPIASHDFH